MLVDETRAEVTVDGRPVRAEAKVYLLLNKPRGPISAVADPQRGRETVMDLLGEQAERLYPVGRLDADTEGLLLITNDGDLTYLLTHPKHGIAKVYEVEVKGSLPREAVEQLRRGVTLEDGVTAPARVLVRKVGKRSRVELTIHEGRKRQVKRMLAAVGHKVVALKRTRVGPLTLGELPPGEWRYLTEEEVQLLREAAGKGADELRRDA